MKRKPELVVLSSGILLVEAELPDFSVRGAVVSGTDRTMVWDTLAAPCHMAALEGRIPHSSVTVVYSHGDWDHVWGTSGLEMPADEIVAHRICAERFTAELPETLEEMQRIEPSLYGGVTLVPPTRDLVSPESFDLGGLTVQVEPFPGHTSDSMVGFIPEACVFLAGDAVESPLPFLNPDSPVDEWARELDQWAERLERCPEACRVVPAHGSVAGPGLLRANARYLRDILSGRPPAFEEPLSPFYLETHKNNLTLAQKH